MQQNGCRSHILHNLLSSWTGNFGLNKSATQFPPQILTGTDLCVLCIYIRWYLKKCSFMFHLEAWMYYIYYVITNRLDILCCAAAYYLDQQYNLVSLVNFFRKFRTLFHRNSFFEASKEWTIIWLWYCYRQRKSIWRLGRTTVRINVKVFYNSWHREQ